MCTGLCVVLDEEGAGEAGRRVQGRRGGVHYTPPPVHPPSSVLPTTSINNHQPTARIFTHHTTSNTLIHFLFLFYSCLFCFFVFYLDHKKTKQNIITVLYFPCTYKKLFRLLNLQSFKNKAILIVR